MRYKTKKKMQYLQETKNLIKDAIIEKGQPVSDTDTFRSYVDKIKALGGGGGGTLPAGIYYSVMPMEHYSSDRVQKWFYYNDELYCVYLTTSGKSATNIKKWNGTSWEIIISGYTPNCGNPDTIVEYHGKIHMFYVKNHLMFDGTTLTTCNATTNSVEGTRADVYQDQLVLWDYRAKSLIAWNEMDDTWTTLLTDDTVAYATCFVIKGDLYICSTVYPQYIYKYENGSLTQISDTLFNLYRPRTARGTKLYYWSDTTGNRLHTYDVVSGELKHIGATPALDLIYEIVNSKEVAFTALPANTAVGFIMHEVTEE